MSDAALTLKQVLGRLGVGQTLRLRRSGDGPTVEIHARADGALEVPAAIYGHEAAGPQVVVGRDRVGELADRFFNAIDDLTLVTSSIVDAAGIERLLDGTGARTDVTVDGHLDRWDLPMIDQVRRYLEQRFSVPPSLIDRRWEDLHTFRLGEMPYLIQVLESPPRIRVCALVVRDVGRSDGLDLHLHRLLDDEALVTLRHRSDAVLAQIVMPAPTFMGQHLDIAIEQTGSVARVVGDHLVERFGGKVAFRDEIGGGTGDDRTGVDDSTEFDEED